MQFTNVVLHWDLHFVRAIQAMAAPGIFFQDSH